MLTLAVLLLAISDYNASLVKIQHLCIQYWATGDAFFKHTTQETES